MTAEQSRKMEAKGRYLVDEKSSFSMVCPAKKEQLPRQQDCYISLRFAQLNAGNTMIKTHCRLAGPARRLLT